MTRARALRRLGGTFLAVAATWGIWRASAAVTDYLNWPDLLPLVRLGAVVAGVTLLDWIFTALRPVFSESSGNTHGS